MPLYSSGNLVVQGGQVVSVKDSAFGAKGDGSTDDTTAIQLALNSVTNGVCLMPPGTYVTSAAVVFNNDNVVLRGSGWGTVIKPAASTVNDVLATPIPGSAGLVNFVRNYIGIEQLMIDCTNMTGTTAGQGNGIHFYGVRYSYIRDVFIKSCKNWAILMDGDNTGPGFNFGYDNQVFRCVFDLCNGNYYNTNCEANDLIENRFKWCGAATAANQPALGTQDNASMHARCGSGYMYLAGNIFGKGGTYTTEAIRLSNSGPCRVIGNRFDQVRYQAIVMNAGNHTFAFNQVGSASSFGTTYAIQIGSSNNAVIGNKFDNTAGAIHYTYAVGEAGGPFSGNTIMGNNFLAGTSGTISQNATSTNRIAQNPGYNPVGPLTPPAVPATTVAQTNNFGVDCTVYIAGGTVTVIAVGGVATGLTATPAMVRVPAGQTITLTYSVAPTWTWFGD